jgi:hypothetical protein
MQFRFSISAPPCKSNKPVLIRRCLIGLFADCIRLDVISRNKLMLLPLPLLLLLLPFSSPDLAQTSQ